MTVKFSEKANVQRLPAGGTKGAGELVRAPIQTGRDALTIIEGGKLPAETVPKRRSTAERVRGNLRATAERVRDDMARAREIE